LLYRNGIPAISRFPAPLMMPAESERTNSRSMTGGTIGNIHAERKVCSTGLHGQTTMMKPTDEHSMLVFELDRRAARHEGALSISERMPALVKLLSYPRSAPTRPTFVLWGGMRQSIGTGRTRTFPVKMTHDFMVISHFPLPDGVLDGHPVVRRPRLFNRQLVAMSSIARSKLSTVGRRMFA
jgi:hypothetical protein